VPSSKVAIAESEALLPLVRENVSLNSLQDSISVLQLELQDDLIHQSHIKVRAHDFIFAVLDIYNSPELTEKLFKVILELSGNGSLLLFAYKRYLKLDERWAREKKVLKVEDFQNREAEFRLTLGLYFQLRSSFQTNYRLGGDRAEVVVTEIIRTPFASALQ